MNELRDKIAQILADHNGDLCAKMEGWRPDADRILAIPEIAEALKMGIWRETKGTAGTASIPVIDLNNLRPR